MSVERISSPVIITGQGQSFSALEINGDGFEVVNAAEERDSTGQTYPAGSQSVISVRSDTGSTINASYIKTGVIDANLMRAGLIQTVPSWNTKWYGAPEDHAAVQMGFTGGSIAATAVSTGSGTVSLTLPSGHGLTTGDYVRVSGLYFTTGTLLGGVGLNLPTNGPLDYASATVATNTLTYSKADITSGLTASTASIVYVGKAIAISDVSRNFDDPDNPAELSTVTVTTSSAHGFSVGDYIELTGTIQTMDGVAYVTTVPTSTTFTFKQRFGDDVTFDGTSTGISLPTLGAPVAIKVLKSYTQNADGSIHITSGTVDAGLIVGTISANDITVGSGSTVARVGSYPNTTSPTFQGFWAGDSDPTAAEFSVSTAGVLSATSATISGAITATTLTAVNSGSIGGWTIGATSLQSGSGATRVGLDNGGTNPSIYAGSSTPGSAPFRVTNAGAVTATSGAIGGWTLGSTSLTAGSAGTTVGIDSGGTNPAFYAGSATPGSAPFRVTQAGAVTATNLTVTGGSISIGNFLLSTSGNITDKLVIQQKFITNENGVDLISTSSTGGSAYALSKSVSDGIYTGIQNGSFGAPAPTLSSNINNSTNALPYWTYADGGSASKPYAQIVASTTAASGYVLRFTIPSGAAVGDYAYIERYVAVPGSYARSYTYQPRAAWSNRSASDTSIMVYQDAQYFAPAFSAGIVSQTVSLAPKTGAQGPKHVVITAVTNGGSTLTYTYTADANNTIAQGDRIFVRGSSLSQYNIGAPDSPILVDSATSTTFVVTQTVAVGSTTFTNGFARTYPGSKLLSDLSTSWGTETWSDPGSLTRSTGAVPEDAAYLRIRVGVLVGTTVGGTARTVDLNEVRLDKGPIQLQLVDQTSPDTYGYGNIWLSGGLLTIAPNQSGLNGGSSGTQNPSMEFASSDGKIYIKPSSATGSVIVTSKTAAAGGSAAAIPFKVQGITSQSGNLQQWLDVSANVLGYVASDGAFLGKSFEAQSASSRDSIIISGRAGGTGDYAITVVPTTLASNTTLTLPNTTGTVALTSNLTGTTFDLTNDVTMTAGSFTLGAANSYAVTVVADSHNHTGATLSAIGSASISASAIGTTQLAASAVTAAKIAANTITGAEIAAGAIGASELSSSISITTSGTMTPTGTADITGTSGYNSVYMGGSTGVVKRFYRFTGVSEERLKENITPTSLSASAIYGLNPIDFNFKASASELYPNIEFPTTRQWGLTVENAREVFPSAISGGQNGDPYGIHWERVYFGMLVAIKDLNARVVELEAKIAELNAGA